MILDNEDLTPEQRKELKKVCTLKEASFPKRVYKYEVLAEMAKEQKVKEKDSKKEKE